VLTERSGGSLQRQLQSLSGQASGRQARRLAAWTSGALRRRRTLGVVLNGVAKRALKGRPPQVVALLELFGYALLFHAEPLEELLASLHELGESKKVSAHVERVLTRLDAAIAERRDEPGEGDDLLPLGRERSIRFKKPVLGVSQRGPAGELGILYSLPDDLAGAWVAAFGEEQARELARAANDPAPLFLRANTLRTTPAELSAALREAKVDVLPTEVETALRLGPGGGSFRHTDPWRAGHFVVQDLTAQRVAPLLAPQPGERVLDLCAAPGGKTCHLAELARDQADVLATDLKAGRLRRVEQNAERLGLRSIRTQRLDGKRAAEELAEAGPFDAILVDAPCSNTGVVRRRPEARWRYDSRSQRRLTTEQSRLLEAVVPLLAPGGRLVYSLCSIEPDEGHERVEELLAAHPELERVHEELWLPGPERGDGGFAALLRLRG